MGHTRRRIALGLLLAAPTLLAQALFAQAAAPTSATTVAPTVAPHRKSHKTQKELVLPPLPSGPLSQLPMDQLPPAPANVSYQGGLLTISAQNSTLGEILRDVRKLTGAAIEIPQGSGANERVVANLGPGEPRDVLVGLLNGSSFNYVMLGSGSNPNAVASLILTPKPSSSGDAGPVVASNVYENNQGNGPPPPARFNPPFPLRPGPQPGQPGYVAPGSTPAANADSDDSKDDDDKDDDDSADDQAQPGQTEVNGGNAQEQQPQADPNQPNAGPKTPEQIMEMLRRQNQPGGAPVPPTPPPQQ